MDRYQLAQIAAGNKPKLKDPKTDTVHSFGFNADVASFSGKIKSRKYGYFDLEYNQVKRVGIVFEDPEKVLSGANTHFCKTYFLCKSTGMKEACCKYSKKVFRFCCILVVYNGAVRTKALTNTSVYNVVPWTFGTQTYEMLKALHETFPISNHDIIVKRNHKTLKTYDIQAGEHSLWQSSSFEIRNKILDEAKPFLAERKNYLGADLSLDEIEDLIRSRQAEQLERPVRVDPVTGTPM